jgi:hypothetical protein
MLEGKRVLVTGGTGASEDVWWKTWFSTNTLSSFLFDQPACDGYSVERQTSALPLETPTCFSSVHSGISRDPRQVEGPNSGAEALSTRSIQSKCELPFFKLPVQKIMRKHR